MKSYIGDRSEIIVGRASGISPDGSAVMAIARTSTTYGNGIIVMRAEDGLNWTSTFLSITDTMAGCAYDPATNTVYVVNASAASNVLTIRTSTDYGVTWNLINSSLGTPTVGAWPVFDTVWFDTSRSRLIIGRGNRGSIEAGNEAIIYTKDNGTTWLPLFTTTEANTTVWDICHAPGAPHPIFFRVSEGSGTNLYLSNTTDDTLEVVEDNLSIAIYSAAGTTVAYSALSDTYVGANAAASATAIVFQLGTDAAYRVTAAPSGNSNSHVAYITWNEKEQLFFATTKANTASSTEPSLYRTYKSKYGSGTWIYDPSPIYNTQNRFGVSMFYDNVRDLTQIYSYGYTTAARIQLGYLGGAGMLPTPTPTPTTSLTPSTSLSNTPTPSPSMAASTFDWIAGNVPSVQSWGGLVYGNSTFIALDGGTADVGMRSSDGINWTQFTKPRNATTDIAYGNGIFVAVSINSAQNIRIMRSADNGVTWTYGVQPTNAGLSRVIFIEGVFYAFAQNTNLFFTSTDGITWTQKTLALAATSGVAYGNGTIVSVNGTTTSARIQYSTDLGDTWTAVNSFNNNTFMAVTYGNGKFVAITSTGAVIYSTDGITWTFVQVASTSYVGRDITFGEGLFVFVGSSNIAYESADGIIWKQSTTIANQAWLRIAYGIGKFVSVSSTGTAVRAMYTLYGNQPTPTPTPSSSITPTPTSSSSPTPTPTPSSSAAASTLAWIESNQTTSANWRTSVYVDNTFYVLDATTIGMYSSDGINWTQFTTPNVAPRSMTYGNGIFVAVGTTGNRVMRSVDGINWVVGTSPGTVSLYHVTYAFNRFYAFMQNGTTYYTSTDGISWTAVTGAANMLSGVYDSVYADDKLVIVTSNGSSITDRIRYSTDGVTWTTPGSDLNNGYVGVTYGNGKFVALSNANQVSYSTNGTSWTTVAFSTNTFASRAIAYGNGGFVIIGNSALTFDSTDGITWKSSDAIATLNWSVITYGDDKFVVNAAVAGTSRSMYALYGTTPTPSPTPSSV